MFRHQSRHVCIPGPRTSTWNDAHIRTGLSFRQALEVSVVSKTALMAVVCEATTLLGYSALLRRRIGALWFPYSRLFHGSVPSIWNDRDPLRCQRKGVHHNACGGLAGPPEKPCLTARLI